MVLGAPGRDICSFLSPRNLALQVQLSESLQPLLLRTAKRRLGLDKGRGAWTRSENHPIIRNDFFKHIVSLSFRTDTELASS